MTVSPFIFYVYYPRRGIPHFGEAGLRTSHSTTAYSFADGMYRLKLQSNCPHITMSVFVCIYVRVYC